MPGNTAVTLLNRQSNLVKLAREIAINHKEVETILNEYSISPDQWSKINEDPEFIQLLQSEIVAWQGAQNTHERTRLKAAALIEMWLEEANQRLYDRDETLTSKTELAKLLARIAEMGTTNSSITGPAGERFTVTINLGADAQLKFDKTLPAQVIDAEAVEHRSSAE